MTEPAARTEVAEQRRAARPLHIAVVGAGTAGAAAAILLARAGHRVEVFERVADPGPVGAGITLQPTGQAALRSLGLLDEVAACGAAVDRLTCAFPDGRRMIDLPYAELDPQLAGLGVHRGQLFRVLFAALRACGAAVHCGVGIASSQLERGGRVLVTSDGDRLGPFELVVAADGSTCELHGSAPKVRSSFYPWGALWLVREDVPRFHADRKIHQIVDGTHTLLGFLPTGCSPEDSRPLVSVFWSLRADRLASWRAAGIGPWRDRVLRLEPRAEPLLDGVRDVEQVLFARYRDVAMWPWHGERIVFLGDAAHATSPQLGQGANMALLDAIALGEALSGQGTGDASGERELARSLAAYSRARRRQLAYYQLATRALTPLFQSDSRLLGWLRDRFFPMSRWVGPLRRRMIRTMVGVDRGVIRRPLPIAPLRGLLPAGPAAASTAEPLRR
jgi:2-polyprenyl-6-methoxyphenol hydroxylase-like FAD-dependent oxidoreductase